MVIWYNMVKIPFIAGQRFAETDSIATDSQ